MQFSNMGKDSQLSLLTRLKRAVKNVRFLLDFNMSRWRLASVLGHASSSSKRISFNDRPGLRAVCDDDTIDFEDSVGSSVASSRTGIQRTISCPSEDDVDKRADMFIANFYHQLQIERQISLELQYCRGNSFKLISPWLTIFFWFFLGCFIYLLIHSFFSFFLFFFGTLIIVCLMKPLIFRKRGL